MRHGESSDNIDGEAREERMAQKRRAVGLVREDYQS